MLAGSSADPVAAPGRSALSVRRGTRAAMVALGFIPLIHAGAAVAPLALAASGQTGWTAAWLAPLVLYLAPPALFRLVTIGRPLPHGRVDPDSSAFLLWWFSAQCQVVFMRLPFLEELLRLVPSVYSAWLRLWGAEVGALVYWSPGVAISDRPLARIGSRVVFGMGARLNAHVLAPDPGGSVSLRIGRISVGDDALIGGYSLLLPGCLVAPREVTPPFRSIHAFTRFEGGRRMPMTSTLETSE